MKFHFLKTLAQNQVRKRLLSFFSILICLSAIVLIVKEFRNSDWEVIFAGINDISGQKLWQAFLFVICSYWAIAYYDILAFSYINKSLSRTKIIFAGLITYAISPNIGFAFLSGSFLRYRLYRNWDISHFDIARIIAFTNLSLWVGIITITGIIFTFTVPKLPPAITFPFLENSLQDLGILCLIITFVYLAITIASQKFNLLQKYKFQVPTFNLSWQQIFVFTCDWGFAALALYFLLDVPIAFPSFFGIYVVAMVAGLISTVPGGLGVFETVMLFFIEPFQNKVIILSTLVVFRCLYYFLPFIIAVLLLTIFEMRKVINNSNSKI